MFKNKKMQLIKFRLVYTVLLVSLISCKEGRSNVNITKKKSNEIVITENVRNHKLEKDSIYFKSKDLVVKFKGKKIVYPDLNKQAMSLSTTLKIIDKGFYIFYDYSGSSTKMSHLYHFVFNTITEKTYLLSKETIKLNQDKVSSIRTYFKSFDLKGKTFDQLEEINENKTFDFNLADSLSIVKLFFEDKQFGKEKNQYKGIDRFVSPYQVISSTDKASFLFFDIQTANNVAYYLEQHSDYKQASFFLEEIIKTSPKRTVAYINLGDSYWGLGKKEEAKEAYKIYIEQMKVNGKEKKIPKRVLQKITE